MSEPNLTQVDPEISALIQKEAQRQHDKVRLIPSENYASKAVLEASGSVLSNKYLDSILHAQTLRSQRCSHRHARDYEPRHGRERDESHRELDGRRHRAP
jgi:hypothetical protein